MGAVTSNIMIFFFLACLTTYFLGFIAGYMANKEQVTNLRQSVTSTMRQLPLIHQTPHSITGAIAKKTPQQLAERRDPQQREAIEAMRDTLDNVPELVKAKEALQEAKKAEYGRK